MQLEDYTTGTVSIANGSTTLTGTGTAWSTANFKAGDTFHAQGLVGIIASVDSDTAITLRDVWAGTSITGGSYLLRYQPDNSRMQGTTRQVLDELRQGIWLTPDATGKTADKATYDARPAGFRFLDVSVDPFKLYVKESDTSADWSSGADWVGPKGDKGDQGATGADGDITWEGAWVTATDYTVNQAVSTGGSSYVCIANHTSGTFADDLAADKWELMAEKGDKGDAGDISSTDTDASSFGFVLDEDDMASDSATKVPTQQSVKAYADLRVIYVDTRTSLKALDSSTNKSAIIKADGRSNGLYVFLSGNQSTHITEDPNEYVWVAPSSDTTGASGAWAKMGGAVGFLNAPGMTSYAYVTAGSWDQPHESSNGMATRPGDAFQRYIVPSHTPDTTTVSQQDSIIYIEGHEPSVEGNLAQEFAALRFNMSSQMFDSTANPSNLDIKGLQGVVAGDGGNAKIRSWRSTSVSINGHYGLNTGGMFAAHRSGVIPTESPFNGNGTDEWTSGDAGPYMAGDAALISQVGPGIQANFRMEGFAGKERPQYGILQGRGAAGLLPEVAAISIHGGGNGRMIQGLASETDATELFYVSKQGATKSTRFLSGNVTVADDGVATLTPPETAGTIRVFAAGTSSHCIDMFFRAGSSAAGMKLSGHATVTVATNAVLTGTTGTDGNLTVSAASDGLIYIENRTGASRVMVYFFMCNG